MYVLLFVLLHRRSSERRRWAFERWGQRYWTVCSSPRRRCRCSCYFNVSGEAFVCRLCTRASLSLRSVGGTPEKTCANTTSPTFGFNSGVRFSKLESTCRTARPRLDSSPITFSTGEHKPREHFAQGHVCRFFVEGKKEHVSLTFPSLCQPVQGHFLTKQDYKVIWTPCNTQNSFFFTSHHVPALKGVPGFTHQRYSVNSVILLSEKGPWTHTSNYSGRISLPWLRYCRL